VEKSKYRIREGSVYAIKSLLTCGSFWSPVPVSIDSTAPDGGAPFAGVIACVASTLKLTLARSDSLPLLSVTMSLAVCRPVESVVRIEPGTT
jgi:hypothetical protein